MGNRTADYAEYIDITTGAIRRKRTGLLLRDAENIFIADNNIPVPKSVKDNFLSQIQSDLPISSEKSRYFTKTSLQSTSEHNTQSPEYFPNVENFSLPPADTLVPITFLDSKAKLTEDKQLIAKNKESIADETIKTVESPEMVIIIKRNIDQKPQVLPPESDSKTEEKPYGAKAKIAIDAPLKRTENEIIELNRENILQDQLEQKLAKEEEQRIAREAEEQEERQRLELEQRLAQEVEEQEERQRLELKQRLAREAEEQEERQRLELEQRLAQEAEEQEERQRLAEVLDKLKEGVVLLELANKQATKLLPGGTFFKEHLLVREAKKQLGLQKVNLENGVIPGLKKLEELEELVTGITRTAEVIIQETQRLIQVEAEKAKIKLEHKIKEPLKVETSFFQKIKEKFSGYFSADDHEPEPKMIEMVSVLGSKVQDNEIPVDPIGEQARVIISDEIV